MIFNTILVAINQSDLVNSFKLMGLGMLGIFVVMIIIYGLISLLAAVTKEKKAE